MEQELVLRFIKARMKSYGRKVGFRQIYLTHMFEHNPAEAAFGFAVARSDEAEMRGVFARLLGVENADPCGVHAGPAPIGAQDQYALNRDRVGKQAEAGNIVMRGVIRVSETEVDIAVTEERRQFETWANIMAINHKIVSQLAGLRGGGTAPDEAQAPS